MHLHCMAKGRPYHSIMVLFRKYLPDIKLKYLN